MKNRTKPKRRLGIVFTLLSDILFQLFIAFKAFCLWLLLQWTVSEQTAARVPGLEIEVVERGKTIVEQGETIFDQGEFIEGQKLTIQKQKDEIAELGETVFTQGNQIIQQGEELATLESRLKPGDPVTFVILIDVTASMGEGIASLQESMAALFEIMPNRSGDFRVGVLAFRDGVVSRFPVTPILPIYEDDGKSQRAALSFLDGLKAEHGYTEHLSVFREGLKMLTDAHPHQDPKRKLRLVFLGDQGPSELDQQPGYNANEREMKKRILRGVAGWTEDGNRAVVTLFAESSFTEQDPAAAENREWFKALGSVSEKSASYSDSNALLRALHNAASK